MSIAIIRVCLSVCVSLCLQYNSKTNDPKVFKLGIGNGLGNPTSTSDMVFRSKGQGHRVTKVQKYVESNWVAGVSLHLYRVPTIQVIIILPAIHVSLECNSEIFIVHLDCAAVNLFLSCWKSLYLEMFSVAFLVSCWFCLQSWLCLTVTLLYWKAYKSPQLFSLFLNKQWMPC